MQSEIDQIDGSAATASPWTPVAATLATIAVVALAMALSVAPVLLASSSDGVRVSVTQIIISVLLSQLVMGFGGWWLAGLKRGDRRAVLPWRPLGIGWGRAAVLVAAMIGLSMAYQAFRHFVLGHDILADLVAMAPLFKTPLWPLTFLLISVGAPLAEEVLFRGFLQSAFARSRVGFWVGAAVATTLWTALHQQYGLPGLLLVGFMGVMFSIMLRSSGSLKLPLVAHALNNTIASLYVLLVLKV